MNRLKDSRSRYLKQHAKQPVDWWPWGEQALLQAQKTKKPLLISVGYSACHWCHVMARESFDDEYIADLMNRHFICVKVDREEHPALDAQLIEAVQLLGEQGGWPLNVFCLPDGRPFFGGTYFPKNDTQGRVPWPQLLMRISNHFAKKPQEFEENAQAIAAHMKDSNQPVRASEGPLNEQALLNAAQELLGRIDPQYGGLGGAPKFPQGRLFQFLMRIEALPSCPPKLAQQAHNAIEITLNAMAQRGLYDALGGGFFRYTVDRTWSKPHFEKMLYDQGLLVECYAQAYKKNPNPLYLKIIEETVACVEDVFMDEAGLCAASLDAETLSGEGAYYMWTYNEVQACLGHSTQAFAQAYGLNLENDPDTPQHLQRTRSLEKFEALDPLRQKMLEKRRQRPAPEKDPKHLLAWNSLWLKGFSTAAQILNRQDWMSKAQSLAHTLVSVFYDGKQLFPLHYPHCPPQGHAQLEDYALLASALLTLPDSKLQTRALSLLQESLAIFKDPEAPGYFSTQAQHPLLPVRKKMWMDHSLPCGQGALLYALSQARAVLPQCPVPVRQAHTELLQAYAGLTKTLPAACPSALLAFVS